MSIGKMLIRTSLSGSCAKAGNEQRIPHFIVTLEKAPSIAQGASAYVHEKEAVESEERWYKGGMFRSGVKAKTSVTLSLPLLVKIDKIIGQGASRSAFIEKVLDERVKQLEWDAMQKRDMELINAASDRLNAEAAETLADQDAFYFDLLEKRKSVA